jgi:hypothetical protein
MDVLAKLFQFMGILEIIHCVVSILIFTVPRLGLLVMLLLA